MVDIDINIDLDIRWKQRFDNFQKAYLLLKEATIQRFEFAVELAWKLLKDKMEYDGVILTYKTPKPVIHAAFNANYINTNEASYLLEMIDARNDTSHDYDHTKSENIYANVKSTYLKVFNNLYNQYSYHK
jgi:nucleotidyltransferase substrate binding protein (TIGR01987 family)